MTRTWTNWAGDQRCTPAAIVRPTSEEQLAEVVAGAAAEGRTVRAVGSGHSFTDCALTDGLMIDMGALDRIVDADPETGLVTVEGGIRLHELGPLLAGMGLGLENQGDIDAQTITGATATATHGTGVRFGNLSSRITAARVVTADGATHDIDGGDELLAARVSLGALGVLTRVTVQTVPLFTLHRRDAPRPLNDTLDRLDELVDDNDHFEFFVFPHADKALTRTTRRSHEEPTPPPAWRRHLSEGLLENTVLDLLCRTGRRLPAAAPALNRFMTALVTPTQVDDRAYKVYASRRRVRFAEMEYAIPRAHAREAIERVIALVRDRRLPILFPLEVRFAAGDDALLSTAHARDSCYIAVHQYTGMGFAEYFDAVEEIMAAFDGRPHWGKRHGLTAATLRERYPAWARFAAVRDRLDPGRTFANAHTERVLGA